MAEAHDSESPDEVAVLVPAAGEGRRLGGERKQFRTLGGKPVLVQVLQRFERHPAVGHLVVAVPGPHVQAVRERLQAEDITILSNVVEGGASRQQSVHCALRAVPSEVTLVLVHDAVRPFVSQHAVQQVVNQTRIHGAASLALPVADTLRRASDEVFGETVDRDGLYRMQTPQGFRREWLVEAHRAAAQSGSAPATDDVGLVQRTGRPVRVVPGSRRNFKITRSADWELAQQLWPAWADDEASSAE